MSALLRTAEALRKADGASTERGDVLLTTRFQVALFSLGGLAVFAVATGVDLVPGITYGLALVAVALASFGPPNGIVRHICGAITAFNGGVVTLLFSVTLGFSLTVGEPIGSNDAKWLIAVLGAALGAFASSLLVATRVSGVAESERMAAVTLAASRHAELLELASGHRRRGDTPSGRLVTVGALVVVATLLRRRRRPLPSCRQA